MPIKAAVREMLPPKRMIWAARYSRSNTSRASRSGSAMVRSAPNDDGLLEVATSCGSQAAYQVDFIPDGSGGNFISIKADGQ